MDGAEQVKPEGAGSAAELGTLDTPTRLKLARGILDQTCVETGAGYVLIMFVPGTDLVLRSYRGLDTPEECTAAIVELGGMLKAHAERLTQSAKQLHNDV